MASILDYVEELSSGVGPRLAGTDKEFQASELIAARFDEIGLSTRIEEFDCYPFTSWLPIIGDALILFGALFSYFIPGATIAGLVMVVLGLVIVVLELFDKNPIHRILPTRLSQNVLARYVPTGSISSDRSRRVVVFAHYDSGRGLIEARPLLGRYMKFLKLLLYIAIVLVFITAALVLFPLPELAITISRYVMLGSAGIVAIALVGSLIDQFQPVQNGANCNASGVAVLYQLAQMLATQGAMSSSALEQGASRRRRRRPESADGQPGAVAGVASAASAAGAVGGVAGTIGGVVGVTGAAAGAVGGVAPATASAVGAVGVAGAASGAEGAAAAAARADASAPMTPEAIEDLDSPEAPEALPGSEPAAEINATPAAPARQMVTSQTAAVFKNADLEDTVAPISGSPRSIAENLVQVGTERENLFVSQRAPGTPPRSARDAAEEEAPTTDAPPEQESEEPAEPAVPEWYITARLKAEQKNQQRARREGESEVIRSRYADIPAPSVELINYEEADEIDIDAATDLAASAYVFVDKTEAVVDGPAAEPEGAAGSAATEATPSAEPAAIAATAAAPAPAAPAPTEPESTPTPAVATPTLAPTTTPTPAPTATPIPTAPDPAAPTPLTSSRLPIVTGNEPEPDRVPQANNIAGRIFEALPPPDLSGIDRQAFRVLPADDEPTPLIIPIRNDESASIATGGIGQSGQTAAESPASLPEPTEQAAAEEGSRPRLFDLPEVIPTSSAPAQQAALDELSISSESIFAESDSVISNTGAFIPLASTGVMKPVGEELLAYQGDEGLFVADADDTSQLSGAHYTSEGTYSDPELMQIKDSALRSFLDSIGERFGRGRKRRDMEDSPSEWLGVDEDFDVTDAGGSLNSWDDFTDDDDLWNGGAYGAEDFDSDAANLEEVSNELLNKEVWLVALGATELKNSGVRYFIKRHERQLKGSLFINVLGVGAGDLCFTILEGELTSYRTDQRLQNLLQAAAQERALPIAPRAFTTFNTDVSFILRKAGRAISLIGMGDSLPQSWRYRDDSSTRLREDKITTASELVLETIKNC